MYSHPVSRSSMGGGVPAPRPFLISAAALVIGTWSLGAVAASSAPSTPDRTNSVYGNGNAGTVFDTTLIDVPAVGGSPGTINLATWGGTESHFAAASGQTLTLRSAAATQGDSNQVTTSSSFNWTKFVESGSSGLVAGAPITVALEFRIDGRTAAGYGVAFKPGPLWVGLPADYSLSSQATARLRLDVYDLDSPDYEGGAPLARVNFVAGANVDSSLGSASPSYPSGFAYTSIGYGVSLQMMDPSGGTRDWTGNELQSASYADALPVTEVFDVNTGLLSVSFDTVVGHRLNLEGSLGADIVCRSYASVGTAPSCAGIADYGNTFDAELTASVAGVTFSDHAPGVFAPVPEPDSWALMAAGVGGLLFRVRRRFAVGAEAKGA